MAIACAGECWDVGRFRWSCARARARARGRVVRVCVCCKKEHLLWLAEQKPKLERERAWPSANDNCASEFSRSKRRLQAEGFAGQKARLRILTARMSDLTRMRRLGWAIWFPPSGSDHDPESASPIPTATESIIRRGPSK